MKMHIRPQAHSVRNHVLYLLIMVLFADCRSKSSKTQTSPIFSPPKNIHEVVFSYAPDWQQGNPIFKAVKITSEGYLKIDLKAADLTSPSLWVANAGDRTVSKINTKNFRLINHYPLADTNGEPCYSPSRTLVNLNGSVWIGCRGEAKKLPHRSMETVDPSLVPETIDHKLIKVGPSGKVESAVRVGHCPRAMAIDSQNHLWVAHAIDDTVWELDAGTGDCILGTAPTTPNGPNCSGEPIRLPFGSFPYGAAIDQRGHLWVLGQHKGNLTEIDTKTGKIIQSYGPYLRADNCSLVYGMAIDPANNIWLGGNECNDILKIKGGDGVDPLTGKIFRSGELMAAYSTKGRRNKGVGVDLNGDIWFASYNSNTVSKMSAVTGNELLTLPMPRGPIGISIDAQSNVWVVSMGKDDETDQGMLTRIEGLNYTVSPPIPLGIAPHTHTGDMLGLILRRLIYHGDGVFTWQTTIDSGTAKPKWGMVTWQAFLQGASYISVKTRCAGNTTDLENTPWGAEIASPGPSSCAPTPESANTRFLQLQVRFYKNSNDGPILKSLKVQWMDP